MYHDHEFHKEHMVVYHAERLKLNVEGFRFWFRELPVDYGHYQKVIRFTLVDEKARSFRVQRWCFKGSIDDWIDLRESGARGKLPDRVKKFCPHMGQESFSELM